MTYNNQPKPDDRSDNVEKLQDMVLNTTENIEKANQTMEFSGSEEKSKIEAKNKRREDSLQAMKEEIQDESQFRD